MILPPFSILKQDLLEKEILLIFFSFRHVLKGVGVQEGKQEVTIITKTLLFKYIENFTSKN